MTKTLVKFCGCTSWDDVALAVDAGADAFGMIFAASPRRITWEIAQAIAARKPGILPVGVFVDPHAEDIARLRAIFPHAAIQLSGNESPTFAAACTGTVIKTIHVGVGDGAAAIQVQAQRYPQAIALFDSRVAGLAGGSGVTFDWSRIVPIARARAVIVAGGLTPENVGACVREVAPFAVDVRSGVETDGRKDAAKMRAFVRAVWESDAA